MNNTDKPESAFPSTFKSLHPDEAQVHRWGMTLRDYFAAKALSTILGQYDFTFFEDDRSEKEGDAFSLIVAKNAYAMADAMLEAREA